jgi:SAM-dependent methyltransferase
LDPDEYKLMASVEDTHWWWRARREIIARVIEQYSPPSERNDRRVLEVGCGTGANLSMLAGFGDVLGAESDSEAITHLRRKHGQQFSVVQHAIPEPLSGQFDILGLFDVLEHIEDDGAALRWVAAQLKPGGIAVITVPAFPFLWTEHDEAAHHFRRYTPAALKRIVPKELEILHATCFNSLLFAPVAAVRLTARLLPKRYRPRKTQMQQPPRPVNWLFYRLFRLERHLAARMWSPFGVSILAVLRRPQNSM